MRVMLSLLSLGVVFAAASAVYLLMVKTQQDKLPANPIDTLNIQNKENWEELETLAVIGIISGAIFTVVMIGIVMMIVRRKNRREQDQNESVIRRV